MFTIVEHIHQTTSNLKVHALEVVLLRSDQNQYLGKYLKITTAHSTA